VLSIAGSPRLNAVILINSFFIDVSEEANE